ncbi:type II toxin-antitoxin system RelE/ParE family toxin [Spirosoma montaniterrae]|uniref:Addiction module toxin RelE n=1 Tax=Spirosoma montaniterrae TaxID=1178516 RepID=A0A1P9WYL9_9BACT|nr:type II toxin-antitoxin system RelE/ParE family toxin [Spirosoma montaniterrae]AQG80471.1 hypothetical protein AWR27_14755 [Spirosoma montaniterrae]
MSYTVIVTDSFKRDAKALQKKYKSLPSEIRSIINVLKETPETGQAIGKACYKIRLAIKSKGKGKRGGARLITCVRVVNEHVFLLAIYDKADQADIANADLTDRLNESDLL